MYRKIFVLVLSAAMLLGTTGCGCGQKKAEEAAIIVETEVVTETVVAETAIETVEEESVPGVVYNPDGGIQDLDEETVNEAVNETVQETEQEQVETVPVENEEEMESSVSVTETIEETTAENVSVDGSDETSNSEETSSEDQKTEYTGHVSTEYEKYLSMSGAEQKAYMESFASVEAFFDWLNAAKEEHERLNPVIEITGDTIDMNEVLGNE